jgi:juvenile hormone-III synthase
VLNICGKLKTKMNNPELYEANNSMQLRDGLDFLRNNINRIKWNNSGARVIDIGCGDGKVTTKILKKFLPENFERLLGCDVNKNMVEFANAHHSDDKTSFCVLDIGGTVPQDMRSAFHHVFSFYALHWIQDQK